MNKISIAFAFVAGVIITVLFLGTDGYTKPVPTQETAVNVTEKTVDTDAAAAENKTLRNNNKILQENLDRFVDANNKYAEQEKLVKTRIAEIHARFRDDINDLVKIAYDRSIKNSLVNNIEAIVPEENRMLADKNILVWSQLMCSSLEPYVQAGLISDIGKNCLNIPKI